MPAITVLYFAQVRERLGCAQERIELPELTSVAAILAELTRLHPQCSELLAASRIAVDCGFVNGEVRLDGASDVAVIPPVSGG